MYLWTKQIIHEIWHICYLNRSSGSSLKKKIYLASLYTFFPFLNCYTQVLLLVKKVFLNRTFIYKQHIELIMFLFWTFWIINLSVSFIGSDLILCFKFLTLLIYQISPFLKAMRSYSIWLFTIYTVDTIQWQYWETAI